MVEECELIKAAKEKELKSIRNHFLIYVSGVFLTFSSYSSMLNLQSSINIEDGLGTISVATSYVTAIIIALFFSPFLIRRFGAKKCMIASEFTYMIYIIANIHPEFYTLIPAAMIVGFGEATIWPCIAMMNVHFGTKFYLARKHPTKDSADYITLYSGYFFTIFQCCQVFGNSITYVALYGFNEDDPSDLEYLNQTTHSWATTALPGNKYRFCGSDDCQVDGVVEDSLNQYTPKNKLAFNILIALLMAMCVAAQLIHGYFVPNISSTVDELQYERNTPDEASKIHTFTYTSENFESDAGAGGSLEMEERSENPPDTESSKLDTGSSIRIEALSSTAGGRSSPEKNENSSNTICGTLKEVGVQLVSTKQLLMIPLTIYDGLTMGFVFSEVTRAYSSCVLGVATVGIHMAIYGFGDAIFSFVIGKFGNKVGRRTFFALAALVDLCNYLYCLLWYPSLESSWTIYVVFLTFGFSDGIWQTLLNVSYIEYFPESHEISITMWSLLIMAGFTIQYGWSTSLCVYVKIYVQLGMLTTGMLCYGLADHIHRKSSIQHSDDSEDTARTQL